MRPRDFFLTFETENAKEAERIIDLYIQIKEKIGEDRVAYGLENEKEDILDDDGNLKSVRLTGRHLHRIDVYKDELIERRPRKKFD
ncbi:hypothetical protein [Planococcus sp. CAU13]|uniref:hypothetical protein n=1 Tax=Planococcus sp. CAU13 TaxID=1541197 RepID=UPI00052FE128|nr:hypothetical protein [Planococcus sp. CAU13]